MDALDLTPSYRKALRRLARGDIKAATHLGCAPTAVLHAGGTGGFVGAPITAPAFLALRDGGYVTIERQGGTGYGPWPIKLTDKGREALAR